ncbi:MAG: hypothetical protein QOI80_1405 [Solirubrobacteraceae bacterium]|nr:hypothetical protein [Solirubrobacteraceae bacterium]
MRRRWFILAGALGAAGLLVILLLAGDDGVPGGGEVRIFGTSAADPVPYDGRSPALAPSRSERVLVELPRPALGASARRAKAPDRRQRAYVRSLRAESTALISALRARDVKLRDVVTFERCWHGFAATIRAKDLSQLQSVGVRVRANRRFFPAFSQPVPAAGPDAPAPAATAPRVTLLAGGVAGAAGYDAVDGDPKPFPGTDLRDPQRREVGGEPLAAALRGLGADVRVVRVSGLLEGEEYARTDTLLDGLEHTVDPDGDGAGSDHDRVALIGVSAPYAGFADAPEAAAVRAAKRLGTVVVAPAGDDGKGAGVYGTIGSPGASTGALAVTALADPRLVAHTTLRVGNTTVTGAAVLAGTPPTGELTTARPPDANTTSALLVANETRLTGKLAIVQAGSNPGARMAAAAGAGAAAVLVADARDDHPLPTVPAGRVDVPVLGVTGPAAEAILALAPGTTAEATGLATPKPPFTSGAPGRFASAGPAYDGTPKPDLSRPGSAIAAGELISGAAVAAARVAVDAARGRDVQPRPDTAEPPAIVPPAVPVGALGVDQTAKSTSVQFTVGSFDRGDPSGGEPGTTVVPAARLELTLTRSDSEAIVERLTPPGGERGVLPGAYAYTLPRALVKGLAKGDYVFRVAASAPRQTEPTKAVSAPFTVG